MSFSSLNALSRAGMLPPNQEKCSKSGTFGTNARRARHTSIANSVEIAPELQPATTTSSCLSVFALRQKCFEFTVSSAASLSLRLVSHRGISLPSKNQRSVSRVANEIYIGRQIENASLRQWRRNSTVLSHVWSYFSGNLVVGRSCSEAPHFREQVF